MHLNGVLTSEKKPFFTSSEKLTDRQLVSQSFRQTDVYITKHLIITIRHRKR